ncbi:MAG: sodium-dependent transporter [Muribaculaceae bacterium]|nr:sodium-dependent transporter [Muribaculaceae bacterium]
MAADLPTSNTAKFSKLGVIAATVGSAIGLGNIWRFPAEAQANGGGAFLIVYIGCVFLLGIPVMLAEMSLGRAGQSDAVGCFKRLTPRNHWWLAGTVGLVATFLIMSFYMVVAAWTLEYFFDSVTGDLFAGYHPGSLDQEASYFQSKMSEYVSTAWTPLLWTVILIGINLAVLLMGVRKGIEKVSNLLMPLLFVLLLVFCVVSLTLPGAGRGVAFFVNPDFSAININVIINALGQAFFSLSLGMGILVTYSAYYPKETHLGRTAVTVSMLDFLMAFLMGLVIFPAVISFGIGSGTGDLEGTTLVFVTLPEIFAHMGGSRIWSSLFFLLLSVAAITSTISGAEVAVAFVRDRFKVKRWRACLIVLLPMLAMSILCSLSLGGGGRGLLIGSMPLFDFLDTVCTNLMLPLSALLICVYVGWVLPKDFISQQLSHHGKHAAASAPLVAFLVRWICPLLISVILIVKLISIL